MATFELVVTEAVMVGDFVVGGGVACSGVALH